jgi:hypothetical protein
MFGYFELPKSIYLILIEECTLIGQILNANVFQVEKLLFVPISPTFTMQM